MCPECQTPLPLNSWTPLPPDLVRRRDSIVLVWARPSNLNTNSIFATSLFLLKPSPFSLAPPLVPIYKERFFYVQANRPLRHSINFPQSTSPCCSGPAGIPHFDPSLLRFQFDYCVDAHACLFLCVRVRRTVSVPLVYAYEILLRGLSVTLVMHVLSLPLLSLKVKLLITKCSQILT